MTQNLLNEHPTWELTLGGYIRQTEPDSVARGKAWKTAIGLQAVDGLQVSDYLIETAREHIEGNITIDQAQSRIAAYYETRKERKEEELGSEEADVVSARIAALLNEDSFTFSPLELKRIHERLFRGIVEKAGEYRPYDISKKEWVLNGRSVLYSSCQSIAPTLDYDFAQERAFVYKGLSSDEFVRHFSRFIAGIWQIHPFREGNTRTTAVFAIKYLKQLGCVISNDQFAAHSWYFRNALVRANYSDLTRGITETCEPLERFFENALLGTQHELKNRYLHVDYVEEGGRVQSATVHASKGQFGTLESFDGTLEEAAILKAILKKPEITQKALSERLGMSERTVKRHMAALQERGVISRQGGKRFGSWVLENAQGEVARNE